MQKTLLILLIAFEFTASFAQIGGKKTSEYNLVKKVAIQGYDAVAYFKQGKAVKGKKELIATYEGVIYQFSSVSNKELFIKNASAYEPQYGGWCAYAMGDSGDKVEINPETFKIVDGKLYVFYNAYFSNTLKSWNKEEAVLKAKADTNWKKITK